MKDQGSLKELRAETLIDAPPASLWASLTDYANLKNILPGYDRSTVLQSGPNGAVVDLGVKASPLAPAFRYQVRITEDHSGQTITIQRVSGDFKNIRAVYRLQPVESGTRTRLSYHLEIDLGSGLPLVGASQMLKGNTHKGMVAMQQYCVRAYRRTVTAHARQQ